jgi:hypothetical protein
MTKIEKRKEFDPDILLHPARAYRTPLEIVNDPDITVQEKRAVLCSWACDACAVEATPEPSQMTSTETVRFDDIMDALKCLDGEVAAQPSYSRFINRAQRWRDLYRPDRSGRQLFA